MSWPAGARFVVYETWGYRSPGQLGGGKTPPGVTVWVADMASNAAVVWWRRSEEYGRGKARAEKIEGLRREAALAAAGLNASYG